MAVDRPVSGCEQDGNSAPVGLAQRVPQGRALEPRPRETPEGRGVAGNLVQGQILGSTVRELVDEVEDQRGHAVLRQMPWQALEQALAVGRGKDLLIADRNVA